MRPPTNSEFIANIIGTALRMVQAINQSPTEADTALFAVFLIQRGLEAHLHANYKASATKPSVDLKFEDILANMRAVTDGVRTMQRTSQHEAMLKKIAAFHGLTDQELTVAKKLIFAD